MSSLEGGRWPLAVRAIHWTLAFALVLNLFVLEEGDPPHSYVGYAAVAAVALRLLLGLFAKNEAAFATYGKNLPTLVYALIWCTVIGLGVSGFLMGLDAFWGDERVESVHAALSKFLMALTAIHLMGVLLDSLRHRRRTWMRMIDGRRPGRAESAEARSKF